jgi:hypothetical protein
MDKLEYLKYFKEREKELLEKRKTCFPDIKMAFASIKDEGVYDVDFHIHGSGYYLKVTITKIDNNNFLENEIKEDIELALTRIKQIHPYVKYTKYKPILNKNIISKISINFEVD